MGRKRRKRIVRKPKRIPQKFDCPSCGKKGCLSLSVKRKTARCLCGFSEKDFVFLKEIPSWWEPVDLYCALLDAYYESKLLRKESKEEENA